MSTETPLKVVVAEASVLLRDSAGIAGDSIESRSLSDLEQQLLHVVVRLLE